MQTFHKSSDDDSLYLEEKTSDSIVKLSRDVNLRLIHEKGDWICHENNRFLICHLTL